MGRSDGSSFRARSDMTVHSPSDSRTRSLPSLGIAQRRGLLPVCPRSGSCWVGMAAGPLGQVIEGRRD
jgi:hypothetical protein